MTLVATLVPLQAAALALPAVAAPTLVLMRDPLKMVLVTGVYGWTLVILFVVFGAPDVALSMLVVSTVAYPLVLLVAIARVRGRMPDEPKEEEQP
jgi:energy-converting hydrogenase B subunit D